MAPCVFKNFRKKNKKIKKKLSQECFLKNNVLVDRLNKIHQFSKQKL